MPGWGVQGGERSQPFVLSYSQLFFTCASFHNKREFNFNALSGQKNPKQQKQGNTQYSIPEQRSELASAVKHIHMHMSLYEVQTTDRRNKNDINPNAGCSMKLLMQNAKTHPFFSSPQPGHNFMQPYLHESKTKMRKDTQK